MKLLLPIYFILVSSVSHAQDITTVAGIGIVGNSGDGGQAIDAKISAPLSAAFDSHGNYYFTEVLGNWVRKVDVNGVISTIAGSQSAGYNGDGIPAMSAELNDPTDVAVDKNDNIYIVDKLNQRIRKIDANTGIITTVAGNGNVGYGGDGGLAVQATLQDPLGICLDKNDNLFVFDVANFRVRKVDATSGIITTIAGNGTQGFSGDGGLAILAQFNNGGGGICMDKLGNLYVGDWQNYRVRKIDTNGIITTFAGNGNSFLATGDGGPAVSAQINPFRLRCDNNNNLFISEYVDNDIRMVDQAGIIHTIAGNGIAGYLGDNDSAIHAELKDPMGLAFDSCNNLYIADRDNNRIRKVTFNTKCAPENVTEISPNTYTFYPNPADDELIIESSAISNNVVIYDLLGRELLTKHVISKKAFIHVAGLMKGIYFLKINDMPLQKFIKE